MWEGKEGAREIEKYEICLTMVAIVGLYFGTFRMGEELRLRQSLLALLILLVKTVGMGETN